MRRRDGRRGRGAGASWGARILQRPAWKDEGRPWAPSFVPLDPEKTYGIVSNNYMRAGGDGYAVFAKSAVNPYDFGPNLELVVADYLAAHRPYKPETDGRITEVKAAAPATAETATDTNETAAKSTEGAATTGEAASGTAEATPAAGSETATAASGSAARMWATLYGSSAAGFFDMPKCVRK